MRRGAIELALQKELNADDLIAGVDEVGRGCLAGPVYAGCTILDYAKLTRLKASQRSLIRDSKTLTRAQREEAEGIIHRISVFHAVASASVLEINEYGIVEACFLAMRRALSIFSPREKIAMLLVDGRAKLREWSGMQQAIIKGDDLCYCIASASILAKLERDRHMIQEGAKFPQYGFERHVGYATAEHRKAILKEGVLPIHRRNFAPIRESL